MLSFLNLWNKLVLKYTLWINNLFSLCISFTVTQLLHSNKYYSSLFHKLIIKKSLFFSIFLHRIGTINVELFLRIQTNKPLSMMYKNERCYCQKSMAFLLVSIQKSLFCRPIKIGVWLMAKRTVLTWRVVWFTSLRLWTFLFKCN